MAIPTLTRRAAARRFGLLSCLALSLVGAALACGTALGPPPGASPQGSCAQGACAQGEAGEAPPPLLDGEQPTGRLVAFGSDGELRELMAAWKEREEEKRKHQINPMKGGDLDAGAPPAATAMEAPAPAARAPAAAPAPAKPAQGGKESITNNQHANVDEGDIVKLHGEHLVVLRRGRLFTISLGAGRLERSAMLDAFGPEIDPRGSWYDEMLIEGDDVVVVGFSYARGGTEIGLFNIDAAGRLTYRSTYHLRSNDYYSARNYASRIVDGRLVFYAPVYLTAFDPNPFAHFPAVRRWSRDARDADFTPTLATTRLYRMVDEPPSSTYAALHTVTSCDLRAATLACESVGMLGPPGRVFYVSPSSVYVWMRDWSPDAISHGAPGVLARLPLAPGAGVTAVRVTGMPVDQFSFEEEGGMLDVFVRSESNGDAMWASEVTAGDAALLRVPLPLFSDGLPVAAPHRYRSLPRPDGYSIQNRFVGEWLLYGAGYGYWTAHQGSGQLHAVRYAKAEEPATIRLAQGVDRIEAMGEDALVVGAHGSDLVFSPIELGGEIHARRDFVRENAAQGELRSHGFFYKPSPGKVREGLIGLPIRSEGAGGGARYLLEGSASVLFVANHALDLSELGALRASPLRTNQDDCRASCVDWYGNARPIFAKNRIFALMGYEIVEGSLEPRSLTERARLSFAPRGGSRTAPGD